MKKIFVAGLSVVMVLSLAFAALAQEAVKVKGTVAKIDEAAKTVTIQPKEGAAVIVAFEDADMLAKVKEGEKGEAKYEVKDGKNSGIKLRKLTGGCE